MWFENKKNTPPKNLRYYPRKIVQKIYPYHTLLVFFY